MLRRRSGFLNEATDTIVHPTKRPYRTGGLILLLLAVIGFIWLFPELHREMRIMRM
jgi:hypothetical protein